MSKRNEIDMTQGPLLGKLLQFALPVMLTNVLQLLYNSADSIIVGRFDGTQSLAAVGSTASLIHLITNIFMGLSLGASVVVSHYKGAGEYDNAQKTVHTAIPAAFFCGLAVCLIGIAASEPLLHLMDTPEDVIEKSILYIRIYFLGMPATMIFNFGASIKRAVGDTSRPLIILSTCGLLNVACNVLFVVFFKWSVAGVAIATIISQTLSAAAIIYSLCHDSGCTRLYLKNMKIDFEKLLSIVKIGLPVGIQNSLFSISNVLIQSTINSFGSLAMAANTAASGVEGFLNAAVTGVTDASMNFTSQNVGAGKYKRIRRVCAISCAASCITALAIGTVIFIFRTQLLGLFDKNPEVVELGTVRITITAFCYWIFALMQVFAGCLRGMGHSMQPMINSLVGVCGLRVAYILTLFTLAPTLFNLYLSYPVSWCVAMLANMICYFIASRRLISGKAQPKIKTRSI